MWSWRVGSWISAWDFLCLHSLETARRPVFQPAEGRVDREGQGCPAFPAACGPDTVRQPCALPVVLALPTAALLKGTVRWDSFSNAWTSESSCSGLGPLWTPECVVLTLSPPPSLPDPRGSREGRAGKAWEPVCPVQHTPRRNVAWIGVASGRKAKLSQPCASLRVSLRALRSLAAGGDVS